MWLLCLFFGFIIGFILSFVFLACVVYYINDAAIKSGMIKLNGKLFTLDEIT